MILINVLILILCFLEIDTKTNLKVEPLFLKSNAPLRLQFFNNIVLHSEHYLCQEYIWLLILQ